MTQAPHFSQRALLSAPAVDLQGPYRPVVRQGPRRGMARHLGPPLPGAALADHPPHEVPLPPESQYSGNACAGTLFTPTRPVAAIVTAAAHVAILRFRIALPRFIHRHRRTRGTDAIRAAPLSDAALDAVRAAASLPSRVTN